MPRQTKEIESKSITGRTTNLEAAEKTIDIWLSGNQSAVAHTIHIWETRNKATPVPNYGSMDTTSRPIIRPKSETQPSL